MHTHRYVYNKGVKEIQEIGNDAINFQTLRNNLVTAKDNETILPWELETPKDVRAGALQDLVSAYKAAFTNLREGNIKNFNIGFKSRKDGLQAIRIPHRAINYDNVNDTLEIFPNYKLGNIKMNRRDSIPKIEYDCRLEVTKHKEWYLIIPYEYKKYQTDSDSPVKKCALDPGVRKFQTLYSIDKVEKFTTNYDLLRELTEKIAFYQSLRSSKKISKQTMSKKISKCWKRHTNLVTDHQYKLANKLANEYSEIYLPKFESQKMVKKLHRTTKFNLLNLNHYKFKEHLRFKCLELGSKLIDCTEEYTSKTCTGCGNLNDVGSSEIYKCKDCGLVIDRDINGSRNIYLKCETNDGVFITC